MRNIARLVIQYICLESTSHPQLEISQTGKKKSCDADSEKYQSIDQEISSLQQCSSILMI